MREQWARNIAIATGVLIVLLAILFARLHNPSIPSSGTKGDDAVIEQRSGTVLSATDEEKIAAGRSVLEVQSCLGCHSIAGEGNPRFPLDGVGKRRTAEAIRHWIFASIELKDQLPAGTFQVKQAYRHLPTEDIDALVFYLQSI